MLIEFVVPGSPVGKGRPRIARRGSHVTTYTPEKTANYENLVKLSAQSVMRGPVEEGALSVVIELTVLIPASWSGSRQRRAVVGLDLPTTKPDLDNVAKAILDACNGVVWRDDKQVCDLTIRKRYGQQPGAVVRVQSIALGVMKEAA